MLSLQHYTINPFTMNNKHRPEWKIRLHQSNLETVKDELIPQVQLNGTLTLEQIIARLAEDSCALSPENLAHAAGLLSEAMEYYLVEGYAVSTPLGTLTPTVTGTWSTDRIQPDERARNAATVRFTLSPRLKKSLANPLFREIGIGAFRRLSIYGVEDAVTHTLNERLTPGRGFILRGSMLLMNGDLPERGVYFLDAATGRTVARVLPDELAVCSRGRIVGIVPEELPAGEYQVKVVSQCTTGPRPMKQAVESTFGAVLRVE